MTTILSLSIDIFEEIAALVDNTVRKTFLGKSKSLIFCYNHFLIDFSHSGDNENILVEQEQQDLVRIETLLLENHSGGKIPQKTSPNMIESSYKVECSFFDPSIFLPPLLAPTASGIQLKVSPAENIKPIAPSVIFDDFEDVCTFYQQILARYPFVFLIFSQYALYILNIFSWLITTYSKFQSKTSSEAWTCIQWSSCSNNPKSDGGKPFWRPRNIHSSGYA